MGGLGFDEAENDTSLLESMAADVHSLLQEEAPLEMYHASFMLHFHHHPAAYKGLPRLESLNLNLVTFGLNNPWGLLLVDGFLYESVGLGGFDGYPHSDLPFDVQAAIRNLFPEDWRFEFGAWYRVKEEELAKLQGAVSGRPDEPL